MSTINTQAAPAEPMSEFIVEDFCENKVFRVQAGRPHGNIQALVSFLGGSTPFHFQASLTPDTARALAAALMILADTAEQYEFEATVQAELSAELAAA